MGSGTTRERIHTTAEDIKAWPIRGIIEISRHGFSDNIRQNLLATGIVVELEDLEDWLKVFFCLKQL
jgi:hypothetical protein